MSITAPKTPEQVRETPRGQEALFVDRLIDRKELSALVCLQRTAIDERVKADPLFPKPIHLSARCVRWKLSSVQSYIAAQGETA